MYTVDDDTQTRIHLVPTLHLSNTGRQPEICFALQTSKSLEGKDWEFDR